MLLGSCPPFINGRQSAYEKLRGNCCVAITRPHLFALDAWSIHDESQSIDEQMEWIATGS
jgi:hypothetical protein